jgi:hypothetical protein
VESLSNCFELKFKKIPAMCLLLHKQNMRSTKTILKENIVNKYNVHADADKN